MNLIALLDQIWLNAFNPFISGIISIDFTDHCPVFIIVPGLVDNDTEKLVEVNFRDFSPLNHQKFADLIYECDFNQIMENNVNLHFEKHLMILNNIYNDCFPYRSKMLSRKRLSRPWLDAKILDLIKLKYWYFKLFKMGLLTREHNNSLKNKIRNIIQTSKRKYLEKCFENSRSDLKKTWKIIKSTLSLPVTKQKIKSILHNNLEYFDEEIIANIFSS